MAQGQEFLQVMYAGQTSAYATAATPNTVLARVQSVTPSDENGYIYDRGLGNGLNPVATYLGPYACGGSINFSVVDFDFLKHWVGPKTGAGTSGDKYTLTEATDVELNTTSLQPFTLETANIYEATDTVDRYVGCVGTQFVLSGEIGGKLECAAQFVARHSTQGSSATSYSANTNPAFIMLNGTWKWGSTPSAIAGVRSFSITYNNGLITDTRSLDSRFINIPVLGQRTYNFSVDIIMASGLSSTIVQDFYGQTASSGPVDGSSSSTAAADLEFEVSLVNGSSYATLGLDQCSIDRISKPHSVGGGLVVMTFEGTGRLGKSNTPILWWTV